MLEVFHPLGGFLDSPEAPDEFPGAPTGEKARSPNPRPIDPRPPPRSTIPPRTLAAPAPVHLGPPSSNLDPRLDGKGG